MAYRIFNVLGEDAKIPSKVVEYHEREKLLNSGEWFTSPHEASAAHKKVLDEMVSKRKKEKKLKNDTGE